MLSAHGMCTTVFSMITIVLSCEKENVLCEFSCPKCVSAIFIPGSGCSSTVFGEDHVTLLPVHEALHGTCPVRCESDFLLYYKICVVLLKVLEIVKTCD